MKCASDVSVQKFANENLFYFPRNKQISVLCILASQMRKWSNFQFGKIRNFAPPSQHDSTSGNRQWNIKSVFYISRNKSRHISLVGRFKARAQLHVRPAPRAKTFVAPAQFNDSFTAHAHATRTRTMQHFREPINANSNSERDNTTQNPRAEQRGKHNRMTVTVEKCV